MRASRQVSEVQPIRCNKHLPTAASPHALRDEYHRTLIPARTGAVETPTLKCDPSDLVNKA